MTKHTLIAGAIGVFIGYFFSNYIAKSINFYPLQPSPTVTNLGTTP